MALALGYGMARHRLALVIIYFEPNLTLSDKCMEWLASACCRCRDIKLFQSMAG